MEENKVLKDYYLTFHEFPLDLMLVGYENEDYKTLMRLAMLRGKKLTNDEITQYFNNRFDVIEPEEQDNWNNL